MKMDALILLVIAFQVSFMDLTHGEDLIMSRRLKILIEKVFLYFGKPYLVIVKKKEALR